MPYTSGLALPLLVSDHYHNASETIYLYKRRRVASPRRARPAQGLTPGVSAVQVPTAAAHSLSVLRTDNSRPSGRGLPRSRIQLLL